MRKLPAPGALQHFYVKLGNWSLSVREARINSNLFISKDFLKCWIPTLFGTNNLCYFQKFNYTWDRLKVNQFFPICLPGDFIKCRVAPWAFLSRLSYLFGVLQGWSSDTNSPCKTRAYKRNPIVKNEVRQKKFLKNCPSLFPVIPMGARNFDPREFQGYDWGFFCGNGALGGFDDNKINILTAPSPGTPAAPERWQWVRRTALSLSLTGSQGPAWLYYEHKSLRRGHSFYPLEAGCRRKPSRPYPRLRRCFCWI